EVRKELKKRNPKFDGTLTPAIENDVVTGLSFLTDEVDNIAPVRALKGLTSLDCFGTAPFKGKLSGLSPLKGMPFTRLNLGDNQVRDLEPLKGMKLTRLHLHRCSQVSDLTPLKGMLLTELTLDGCQVQNLEPLK